jgi:hypothetical protein
VIQVTLFGSIDFGMVTTETVVAKREVATQVATETMVATAAVASEFPRCMPPVSAGALPRPIAVIDNVHWRAVCRIA